MRHTVSIKSNPDLEEVKKLLEEALPESNPQIGQARFPLGRRHIFAKWEGKLIYIYKKGKGLLVKVPERRTYQSYLGTLIGLILWIFYIKNNVFWFRITFFCLVVVIVGGIFGLVFRQNKPGPNFAMIVANYLKDHLEK
ncbi:MAG: hypothetical protein MRZ79_03275 [Bacteroidia bacterium]|nr:hypothetical protein [Bacteroidia bacterium]